MKIFKLIIMIIPKDSYNHDLCLPYSNLIRYELSSPIAGSWILSKWKICKHLKPNTGIRYAIIGKWWYFLIIKQIN